MSLGGCDRSPPPPASLATVASGDASIDGCHSPLVEACARYVASKDDADLDATLALTGTPAVQLRLADPSVAIHGDGMLASYQAQMYHRDLVVATALHFMRNRIEEAVRSSKPGSPERAAAVERLHRWIAFLDHAAKVVEPSKDRFFSCNIMLLGGTTGTTYAERARDLASECAKADAPATPITPP